MPDYRNQADILANQKNMQNDDLNNSLFKALLQQQNDRRLKQTSGEQEMAQLQASGDIKRQLADEAMARDMAGLAQLKSQGLGGRSIKVGDLSVGETPAPNFAKTLTPGQIEAERIAAKKIADYEAAGGRTTTQKNIDQVTDVQKQLTEGKRDSYDRIVGGGLSNWPTLMGILAPSEKARRDKARNTANNVARQSDPNPTQQQIESIMGQIYDPSSDNETNLQRLNTFQLQQKGTAAQMEQAAKNLSKTGYSMPGIAGNPAAPTLQSIIGGGQTGEKGPPVKKQYSASRNKTKLIYADGTEEVVDGKQ